MSSLDPVVEYIQPAEFQAARAAVVVLRGAGFLVGAQVLVAGALLATAFVSGGELRFNLPGTLPEGEYDVVVYNPDGGISRGIGLSLYSTVGARPDYVRREQDPRDQPLTVPMMQRRDSQRVLAGSQFDGTIPNAEQGKFGDVAGPTSGGLWRYNDDIVVREVDFHASAAEAAPRGVDSGLYVVRVGQTIAQAVMLWSVGGAGPEGVAQDVSLRDSEILVMQGEALFFKTSAATLEMMVSLLIERQRIAR